MSDIQHGIPLPEMPEGDDSEFSRYLSSLPTVPVTLFGTIGPPHRAQRPRLFTCSRCGQKVGAVTVSGGEVELIEGPDGEKGFLLKDPVLICGKCRKREQREAAQR